MANSFLLVGGIWIRRNEVEVLNVGVIELLPLAQDVVHEAIEVAFLDHVSDCRDGSVHVTFSHEVLHRTVVDGAHHGIGVLLKDMQLDQVGRLLLGGADATMMPAILLRLHV